ncbi:hypothetical protein SO802_012851 [Lithocarpus litseifolius]|uniref:Uncharacterized protein n=1 Tax=Lithocarpus litseifolius TaxID=425828 RepID=A0AAW2D7X4_9ROSI
MTPAKGEGSSRHKGNKIAANDPTTKTVGEDAPLSESKRFEEEEGGHDSDCVPFIDLWYDTHIHFSVVLDDYLPLSPGHVWLFICLRDTEVSWAPSASSISDLDIRQGTLLPMPILFEFGLGTSLGWKEWVDEELSDMGFMAALRQANIATHNFFISCGKITVALEDVVNQLLLTILRDVYPSYIELSPKEEAVEAELKKEMSGNAKLLHWVGAFFKASDKAYRNSGVGFTCADSVLGPFTDIAGTTTPLTTLDERGITYLAAINAGLLPYLDDEGIRFVHYSANRVRRQFGLDQDIFDDFTTIL